MKDYEFVFERFGTQMEDRLYKLINGGWEIDKIIPGHDGWLIIASKVVY